MSKRVKVQYERMPQGFASLKLPRYHTCGKYVRFSKLPPKFRPLAEARLASLFERYKRAHGHEPSQPRFALMIGNAAACTRNYDMKNPNWRSGNSRAQGLSCWRTKRARASLPPMPRPEPRSVWNPSTGA